MTFSKRLIDVILALAIAVIIVPVGMFVMMIILIRDGRPIFYVSERMKTPDAGFQLIKFRTMEKSSHNSGVSGGDKSARITKTGAMLRRTRLDEIPQLWNILRGDVSFVGPRPPLRHYVEMFPDLYRKVLMARPGVTGLATLVFHSTEERLLKNCRTAEETEAVYVRRCIPQKAQLDIIYLNNRDSCFDFKLMVATVIRSIPIRSKRP